MKYRIGFISNSSSTSFVVAFPIIPQNEEEMNDLLFDKETTFISYFETKVPKEKISNQIFSDFIHLLPANEEQIINVFKSGYIDGGPDISVCNSPEDRKKYDIELKEYCENEAHSFIKKNRNKFFFIFHYGNELNNDLNIIEHGPIFTKLSYYKISNH